MHAPFLEKIVWQRGLLVAAVVAVYVISLAHGFVWDDKIYFVGNPVYRDFNLKAIFFTLANSVEYLPLRDLTYAIDYRIWGANPFGFHLTNLALFTCNVLLVHAVVRLLVKHHPGETTTARFVPLLTAAGFAVHPLNTEVVNFVTCRNVLVSGVFFFLAFFCLLRFVEEAEGSGLLRWQWYGTAIAAFIGALLGKATTIMFPLLALVTLPVLYPGRFARIVRILIPFFAIAGAFFFMFKRIADVVRLTGVIALPLEGKIAQSFQIPLFYLKKLFIPHAYNVLYEPKFALQLLSAKSLAALVALVVLVVGAYALRRKCSLATLGIAWFLVALVPVLNFFGTNPVVADRYAFLPSFGVMLAAASGAGAVGITRIRGVVTLAILAGLASVSVARSLDWRSSETLWKASIRNLPLNTKSYLNLAFYYFNNNDYQKTMQLLSENRQVPWLTLYAHYFEGVHYFQQNNLPEAKKCFNHIVNNMASGFIAAHYYLGLIASREGDYMSAVMSYNRALNSTDGDPFVVLRYVRENLQKLKAIWLDQYLAEIGRQVAERPGDLASRKELALALDNLGMYGEALEQYLVLERAGVSAWQLDLNIANCYFNMNRYADAVSYYEKVIALGGDSEDAYNNFGISYRALGKYEKSLDVLGKGVERFPAAPFLAYNRAVTLFASGQRDQARSSFVRVEQKFPDLRDKVAPYLLQLSEQ